jgi:hypothetical protein
MFRPLIIPDLEKFKKSKCDPYILEHLNFGSQVDDGTM